MIAVCGTIELMADEESPAVALASRAARAGAAVQLVGIVRDDPGGDRRLIELAQAGIGHAAVLRGRQRDLEPADVDLALRYLPDIRVVVDITGLPALHAMIAEATSYVGATLVVIGISEVELPPEGLSESAILLAAPPEDPEGTFAGFVATFAAHMDMGQSAADAWQATVRELAVDPVTPGPGRRLRTARG